MSELNSSCPELNNIQYRNMLINGNTNIQPISSKTDLSSIENILHKESNSSKNVTWNKFFNMFS